MLENLLRKFTLYLFKSCSNFFINHIISRINHEFFLEKRVQYTQFVFFLISTLAKLFESNFQAVKGLDSRGPSETNKVRGCFEFLTASRGRIRALFPPLSSSFPPPSFCLLTLACIVVYFKDTYLRVFWTMYYSRKYFRLVLVEVYIRAIHCEDFLTIQLPGMSYWPSLSYDSGT